MKRIIIFAVTAFAMIATVFSQKVAEETRELSPFSKIDVSRGVNVVLSHDGVEEAMIRIINAPADDVVTEVKGSTLNIRMKLKPKKGVSVTVYVSYDKLNEISVSSGGTLEAKQEVSARDLEIKATTGSEITLSVETENLIASSGQGSILKLKGTTNTIEASANSGAKLEAKAVVSKKAVAKASTGAKVEISVNETLEASASSGGVIKYCGTPTSKDVSTSLGGSVENIK